MTQDRPLFFITNDDGIHAPGLKVLAEALKLLGDICIVAPHIERSATSQCITIASPIRFEQVSDDTYAVEGTPADCVMFGLSHILKKKPSWVVSGINRGGNLGFDTMYSGTVGAALEGCMQGVPSIAISCEGRKSLRYDTAARALLKVLSFENELKKIISPDSFSLLNINVPSIPFEDIKGYAFTVLGRRKYEPGYREGKDPRGRAYFWLGGGGEEFENIEQSDCTMLSRNYVTLSVLKPDLFHDAATAKLKNLLAEKL